MAYPSVRRVPILSDHPPLSALAWTGTAGGPRARPSSVHPGRSPAQWRPTNHLVEVLYMRPRPLTKQARKDQSWSISFVPVDFSPPLRAGALHTLETRARGLTEFQTLQLHEEALCVCNDSGTYAVAVVSEPYSSLRGRWLDRCNGQGDAHDFERVESSLSRPLLGPTIGAGKATSEGIVPHLRRQSGLTPSGTRGRTPAGHATGVDYG